MDKKSPSILLADDEPIVRHTIGSYLRESGYQVLEANDGYSALQYIENRSYDLGLFDIRMPRINGLTLLNKAKEMHPEIPVILITAHGNLETAIQALRSGAEDFITKPIKLLELDAILKKSFETRNLKQEKIHPRKKNKERHALQSKIRNLVGDSEAIHHVREQIQQVVEAELEPILITGETGTGKEIVSREIHSLANLDKSNPFVDKNCPFIAVNCPSLPGSLIETELFGHVKGTFTGATTDRAGYFELADGGTLFLDEVSDLSPSAQANLLRVLEAKTLRRIGGTKEIHVDVRVIAASNVDLKKNVAQGKFRRDLYYRLNAYNIHLSPLRERKEDITQLTNHFIDAFSRSRGIQVKRLSPGAEKILLNYDFPGNIRELKNIVKRAVALCNTNRILREHLDLSDFHNDLSQVNHKSSPLPEDTKILKALKQAKWNRRIAAINLKMPYSTLRYKMQKYGIK